MLDYRLWSLRRAINETNLLIAYINENVVAQRHMTVPEALGAIPKLEYEGVKPFIDEARAKNPKGNPEKEGIRNCLVFFYKKEKKLQERYGGIVSPAGVIIKKITHSIFNYDQIQGSIETLLNAGRLHCCDALIIRMRLKEQVFKSVEGVINNITELKLGEGVNVSQKDLHHANFMDYEKNMKRIREERRKADCGDCGGQRSSQRREQRKENDLRRRYGP